MKKRVVQINLGNFGSTGRIMAGISEAARQKGFEMIQAFPSGPQNVPYDRNTIIICSNLVKKINQKLAYYTGLNDCFSVFSTLSFIRKLKRINPDIVHLHNLHNSYLNIPLLFRYLKKNNRTVVWTLHDCWPFTGRCPHFLLSKCKKWVSGCGECVYPKNYYPTILFDNSAKMWRKKKKWFTEVKKMTIVSPSKWLSGLIKQSFLRVFDSRVINNGIDLNCFKPCPNSLRRDFGIPENNYILLGVSFDWGYRKGLDVFIELSKRFSNRPYCIVLVGVDKETDEKIPEEVITIPRTSDVGELAKIYSSADLFINPTREDNFPTVNIEALACGTPVLTYDTGGSPEIIDSNCGMVVASDDIDSLENNIVRICEGHLFSPESCTNRAKRFDMTERFDEYVRLYESL